MSLLPHRESEAEKSSLVCTCHWEKNQQKKRSYIWKCLLSGIKELQRACPPEHSEVAVRITPGPQSFQYYLNKPGVTKYIKLLSIIHASIQIYVFE